MKLTPPFKPALLVNMLCICFSLNVLGQLPPVFKGIAAESYEKDNRIRVYLPAQKVLWKSDLTGKFINNEANLLKPGKGQAALVNKGLTVLKNDAVTKSSLLLDFGKELQGGLQLVTGMMKSKNPVKVRIRFGESASEAMSDVDTVKGATNDHAMRDFVIELPWLGTLEIGNTGFRFVRIDVVSPKAELLLKEVRAIFTYRDIPYLGSFKSSDNRLNNIWATGAYTVHLNMQQFLWDGIKRDRLVWVGDMHPEMMTISSVFGNQDIIPKSLDLAREQTPLPGWMNGISAYSMWWILLQRDWYQYQGNLPYLKQQQTYLTGLLNQLVGKIDDNGLEKLDGGRFLDWPSSENNTSWLASHDDYVAHGRSRTKYTVK
jgi:alpha-L-rhamnosidase